MRSVFPPATGLSEAFAGRGASDTRALTSALRGFLGDDELESGFLIVNASELAVQIAQLPLKIFPRVICHRGIWESFHVPHHMDLAQLRDRVGELSFELLLLKSEGGKLFLR